MGRSTTNQVTIIITIIIKKLTIIIIITIFHSYVKLPENDPSEILGDSAKSVDFGGKSWRDCHPGNAGGLKNKPGFRTRVAMVHVAMLSSCGKDM